MSPAQGEMISEHSGARLLDYQRSLCDPELLKELDESRRPSPARFYAVALGLSEWTSEERLRIDADPGLREYEERMRAVGRSPRKIVKLTLVERPIRAAAQAASQASDSLRLVNREEGYDVLIYPAATPAYSTIQFVGVIPPASEPVSLDVAATEVDLVVDQHGYATVRTEDILPIQTGSAESCLRIGRSMGPP